MTSPINRSSPCELFGIPFWVIGVGMAVIWVFSNFLPALGVCSSFGPITWYDGPNMLILGMLATFYGLLGWWANFPLFHSFYRLLRNRPPSLGLSASALLMALTSFLPVELPIDGIGTTSPLCAWGRGFWMWFALFPPTVLLALRSRRMGHP